MQLANLDIAIIVVYFIGLFTLAQWLSRSPAGRRKDSSEYFLASKNLPWWAIGASLIAANISAEQIVGMSGSGYAIGLAIASYEWMAALTLVIVGIWFLPIFLENRIYTMPQFLEQRYGARIRTLMALFWLALYVFVNLTSIIWLGSIAVSKVAGIDQSTALVGLGLFALVYQLRGGLRAVAMTDIVQVTLLALDLAVLFSLYSPANAASNRIQMAGVRFGTSRGFNLCSIGVVLLLVACTRRGGEADGRGRSRSAVTSLAVFCPRWHCA